MAIHMTLGQLIDEVKALKPGCAFTDEQLTTWVNEIEGTVQTDVMLFAIDDLVIFDCKKNNWRDNKLLVAFPHSKLYKSYVCAMIDFANGEYDKYQNTMQMFNSHWNEFVKWFARNYRPADMKRIRKDS